MALTAYQTQTARLLQNPGAPTPLYSTADLTSYINTARGQIAGEGECIRVLGTLALVAGTRNYPFSAINLGGAAGVTGVQGVINVRQVLYAVGTGFKWLVPRPFEWFTLFHLNNPVPINGPPKVWAQFGQGATPNIANAGVGGSLYVDPPPDIVYTLTLDCVCYPQPLAADADVEAIPYLWTDAVPFYAAYYALLSSQTSARQADANRMFQTYQEFVARARRATTPSVLPTNYSQQTDPTRPALLGMGGGR